MRSLLKILLGQESEIVRDTWWEEGSSAQTSKPHAWEFSEEACCGDHPEHPSRKGTAQREWKWEITCICAREILWLNGTCLKPYKKFLPHRSRGYGYSALVRAVEEANRCVWRQQKGKKSSPGIEMALSWCGKTWASLWQRLQCSPDIPFYLLHFSLEVMQDGMTISSQWNICAEMMRPF